MRTFLVIFIVAGVLAGVTADLAAVRWAAEGLFLLWLALSVRDAARPERVFIGVSVLMTAVAYVALPAPTATVEHGLERAILFFGFTMALNFLHGAASSSRRIARAGQYLAEQPASRRYAALTAGAHFLTISLSVAGLHLLGAMVARGDRADDQEPKAERQRRMATALLRGYAAVVFWSPTGLGAAATLSIVGPLTWTDLASVGFILAALFLAVGGIMDWATHSQSGRAGSRAAPKMSAIAALLPAIGAAAALVGTVVVAQMLLPAEHGGLLLAVVWVMPIASFVWLIGQNRELGWPQAIREGAERMAKQAGDWQSVQRDATIIALSGYISVLVATLAARFGLGGLIGDWDVPLPFEILLLPLLIVLLSQLGISPLVSAVVLGSTLAPLVIPDSAPPLTLALAILGGWVLSLCTAPYSGGAIMLARSMGCTPEDVTRWNRLYAAVCFVILTAVNCGLLIASRPG